jgi:L-lactate dehydrogenase complex protein LldG
VARAAEALVIDGSDDATRARFFARVVEAVGARATKRPAPEYGDAVAFAREAASNGTAETAALAAATDPATVEKRVARFRERLEAAHGRLFTDVSALVAWLAAQGARHGYCDPALAPILAAALAQAGAPSLTFETELERSRIDDYRFGITRAAGAIAETGTIVLDDAHTSRRLAALAPWIHVAVFGPAQIHAHVIDAIAALGDDPNVIWCTGPSKTADVEGILIEGVHGPGEQLALVV